MASIFGKNFRSAWTTLGLLLLIVTASVGGAGLTPPHADIACPTGAVESCAAVGPVDEEHCHCLRTLPPPVHQGWHDHGGADAPLFATGSRFRGLVADATPSGGPVREGGPPRGSPFASGTGLTLHD